MKKFFTLLMTLFFGGLFLRAEVGESFTYESINYVIVRENPNEVEVSRNNGLNESVINIPETVEYNGFSYTVIGLCTYSFSMNHTLTSISFPETLTYIGGFSFAECSKLKNVSLPRNLLKIDEFAFYECPCITSLVLPESLMFVEVSAFDGCSSLNSIEVKGLQTIFNGACFFGCPLETVFIACKNIISSPFAYIDTLTSVTFEETVETIGNRAFAGTGIKSLIFPKSLKNVEDFAFEECLIESMNINSDINISLNSIPYNELTKVTFGDGATTIPSFSGAGKLTDVTLPTPMTNLPDNAFTNCVSLKTIELPAGLETIGNNAFSGCTALSEIQIPSRVTSIGNNAFSNTALSGLTLPIGVEVISDNLLTGCKNIQTFEVPSHITSIGSGAFSGTSLTEIQFPASLTTIGNSAFANTKITDVTLPNTLTSVGNGAFTGCPVETFTIMTNAPINGVFSYDNLTTAVFGGDATTIPEFSNAVKLSDVTLPKTLETIPANGFSNCISLMTLEIPETLSSIGTGVFRGCSSLTTLRLPESLDTIPENAFADCESLEKVYFSDNVEAFGMNAFQNCINLRSLVIPEGVKEIPYGLLQGCSSVSEILVPNSVTNIASNAFQGCSSLRNIDLGTGMYSIGDYAFADCDNITNIHSMALNPPYAEMYTFPTQAYTNATVTVREQSLATYNRENPWYRFQNYLTVSGAISLSHYNVDMAGNEVFQLGVYGSDNKIEWTSSNPSVAYANECGLIVAMGLTGSTVITAHVDSEEINCNVTVSSPYRDPQASTRAGEDEDLQPVDIIMEGVGGNPPMVNVRLVPVGSKTIIDWTSSDTALASVNNGLVTVYADGDVDFGVETENGLEESVEVDTQNIDQAGIEEIFSDGDIMTPLNVYDLYGRIIYFNATLDQIKSLDKGLYIIKGKKMLIK